MTATYVRLRVEPEDYALPVEAVLEVARAETPTAVPGAPPHILGAVNVRGAILPVIDLAALTGLGPTGQRPMTAVVEGRHGRAALAVDAVVEVSGLPETSAAAASELTPRTAMVEGTLVGILDVDAVLSAAAWSSRP